MIRNLLRFVFIILCIIIGLYPLVYFFIDSSQGLLSSKSVELLSNTLYMSSFYLHIFPGGIALLIGWLQFNNKLRIRIPKTHRILGKIYVISACFSAVFGIAIAFFATGGIVSSTGFICLGIIWLSSTLIGFKLILKQEIIRHKKLMTISYSMCFAAVTLRLWLPVLTTVFHDFVTAYIIVSWLCWVPNLLVGLKLAFKVSSVEM